MTPNTPMMAVLNDYLNRRGFPNIFKCLPNIQIFPKYFKAPPKNPVKLQKSTKSKPKNLKIPKTQKIFKFEIIHPCLKQNPSTLRNSLPRWTNSNITLAHKESNA
ncbi:hypothetical protein KFK09_001545 [Dendrobium nobile]|uniref:Uncharacterized protein n=1 Tax=Dendrobium nobile TaxID=94219 RepID=A0A8T3C5A6_DENNO|nr:hypothetical protein KFK09_001545 [Dendrobium nobile]